MRHHVLLAALGIQGNLADRLTTCQAQDPRFGQQINRLRRKEEAAPPPPSMRECPECLSEIPIAAKRCRFCTASLAA